MVLNPHVERTPASRGDERTTEQFHAGQPLTEQGEWTVSFPRSTSPPEHKARRLEQRKAEMKAVGQGERRRPSVQGDEPPAKHSACRSHRQRQRSGDVEVELATEDSGKNTLVLSTGSLSLAQQQSLQTLCTSNLLPSLL